VVGFTGQDANTYLDVIYRLKTMRRRCVDLGFIVLAVLVNALIGIVTETATLLASTPISAITYTVVGILAPQLVGWRRTGSPNRLGMAAIAAVVAVGALVVGLLSGGLLDQWTVGFVDFLILLVVGAFLGNAVVSFQRGDRGAEA
jgi:hypothetical protein